MEFSDYATIARTTRVEPDELPAAVMWALGIAGEAGEVVEKIKKCWRDGELDRDGVLKELGDLLWYTTALAEELDSTLTEVAMMNITKLQKRLREGTIQGTGDER